MSDGGHIAITVLCVAGAVIIVVLLTELILRILASPFEYPYKIINIDVSGRRSPKMEDLIDRYLIEEGLLPFTEHLGFVEKWKQQCQEKIEHSKLKKRRERQYLESLDDGNMFVFRLLRSQTRYRQVNYIKTAYKVRIVVSEYTTSYQSISERFKRLEAIGFECTLSEFHAANQRKMMTPDLREKIMRRDNFTCQICGKYMPDGVGLHIDHIIPVAKGGKSVPSNLQVLCSKCNGRKSSK